MLPVLEAAEELAVDLEHHHLESFLGITCLMQVSTRDADFILDTLSLGPQLAQLAKIFENPNVVKVLHGADSDVLWLQRDFGIYIVNLFDTGRACRALGMPAGYASLLQHYCGVKTDKRFQMADWRQRPLSEEMAVYARTDTHYLLHLYDCLKVDLERKTQQQGSPAGQLLRQVWDTSKRVAL